MAHKADNERSMELASKQDSDAADEWKIGSLCELYNQSDREWIEGEVIDIFTDDEGQWVKVKYGRNTKEMPPNDKHLRAIDSEGNKLKWQNVVEAVKQELYPLIATSLGEAVEELIESKTLKPHDLSDNTTDLVIEKLKTKKVLFSKEIEYIKGLVQRASAFRWDESESMFLFHSLFPIQFNHSADSATLH